MSEVATANGYESFLAFLNGTDPELNPDVPAGDVFIADLKELEASDLMIAYLGEPSTGTGQEIEFARNHNIPVYLLYEKGVRITRMVLGSPNVNKEHIVFTNEADALAQLDTLLKKLKN